jgi:type III secretion protein N (ATPase)
MASRQPTEAEALAALRNQLSETFMLPGKGVVQAVQGLAIHASMPGAALGEVVSVQLDDLWGEGARVLGQVVALSGADAVLAPLDGVWGLRVGADVQRVSKQPMIEVGDGLLGRVVDGLGRVMDGGPTLSDVRPWPIERAAPHPMRRAQVASKLTTGLRVIDGLLTLGHGQRVGVLAPPGVGKSSLMATLAKWTQAQVHVVVLALVGERGREVRGWIEEQLGEEVMKRAVVVVATSDQPAQQRVHCALVATAIAEYFRDVRGCRVLLLVDSLTRLARAHREVAFLRGELPVKQGYPASLLGFLAKLLERAGVGEGGRDAKEGEGGVGSVTAVYSLLTQSGEEPTEDPVADEVMGLLDGHIVLSAALAAEGHWPAVDVSRSLSRLGRGLVGEAHTEAASALRRMIAVREANRELLALAGHRRGMDRALDDAMERWDEVLRFLRQKDSERAPWAEMMEALLDLTD